MGVSIGIERIFSILEAQAQVLFEYFVFVPDTLQSNKIAVVCNFLSPCVKYTVAGIVEQKICTHLQYRCIGGIQTTLRRYHVVFHLAKSLLQ